MAVTNIRTLDAYAQIAVQTYLQPQAPGNSVTTPDVQAANGTYTEITQIIDGPLGFQARAFLNSTNNELVIAFAGTEGLQGPDLSGSEFYGALPLMTPRPTAPAILS
jgi:hypothetical protein